MTPQTITETMNNDGFGPEQLPGLWRKITAAGGPDTEQSQAWNNGIDAMYRRCTTYPQHAELCTELSSFNSLGTWVEDRGHELLRQATPEQLIEALRYKQAHPGG